MVNNKSTAAQTSATRASSGEGFFLILCPLGFSDVRTDAQRSAVEPCLQTENRGMLTHIGVSYLEFLKSVTEMEYQDGKDLAHKGLDSNLRQGKALGG